jgi:peroxiredoxin Q/BCP
MPATPQFRIGSKAPTFSLKDQDGASVSLSDFAGSKNVVLVFYPGDMTPGCTMQLCAIRDDWSKFETLDTVVFGINPAKEESHHAFRDKHAFPFPLLIDTLKKAAASYDAIRSLGPLKLIRRTVVAISKDGTILYYRHGMPKNADILKAIQTASVKK